MKSSLDFKPTPLAFYLFILLFTLFLGATLGGPFTGLASVFFLLITLDILQMFWTQNQLFLGESFNTEHPMKGEILEHKLTLESGRMPLRSSRIDLDLSFSNPLSKKESTRETLWLGGKQTRKTVKVFSCRHRGIYTLGLKKLEIVSWFGWITYSWGLWPRTFYVLPKIIELKTLFFSPSREGVGNHAVSQAFPDPSQFDYTIPYREGIALKYVNWRPLSWGGDPMVKKFLPEIWSEVQIFLDVYRSDFIPSDETENQLDCEDLGLETAASLIKHFLDMGIPCIFRSWNQAMNLVNLVHPEDFIPWLESTVNLSFGQCPSLAEIGTGSGFFITHRPDIHLWDYLEFQVSERTLISITMGWSSEEKKVWEQRKTTLMRSGCRVLSLERLEDLLGASHG